MKKVEENKTHWYNVKINDSTQCFIETLRKAYPRRLRP